MSASNFPACFLETEKWEGWHKFSLDPHDPGGATWCGLTQRAYDAWRVKQGLPRQGVRKAADDEVRSIFRSQYWDAVRGDDLWAGLDMMAFDIAINSGPVAAARMVQRAVGAPVDGWIGLETLHAAQGVEDREAVLDRLHEARLGLWRMLPGWRWFGAGWSHREADVYDAARGMLK